MGFGNLGGSIMLSFFGTVLKRKDLAQAFSGPEGAYFRMPMFAAIIISFFMFTGYAKAENAGSTGPKAVEIEYGYPDQSIFVATLNDKGQPDTPMTHLAQVLMERAGLQWHAAPYPARRLFKNLKSGITNFSILVRASSLKNSCIFSRKPVYSTKLNVYYIVDKPPVKSREDLVGKEIITIRGYSYAGLLKFISDPANKISNQVAGSHKAAFEMLKGKRADYLVDYASAAGQILSESPIRDIRSNAIGRLDIFLVLSKTYPNAETLMVKLENIVETLDVNHVLKGEGTIK